MVQKWRAKIDVFTNFGGGRMKIVRMMALGLLVVASLMIAGCSKGEKTAAGVGIGAATGAVIGGAASRDVGGALLGGALGGIAGGVIGHSMGDDK